MNIEVKNGKTLRLVFGSDMAHWCRRTGAYGSSTYQSRVYWFGIKRVIGFVYINAWGW